ncbi:MAG: hypothetical protein JXB33_04445 [Clostridia bacterium]|nr:hypothetical protein [Clostridia bacterium]
MEPMIVQLLVDYEMAMAGLYEVCAARFPSYKDFWLRLSAEEKGHAKAIGSLMEKVDGKNVILDATVFKARPIEISIEYADEVAKRVSERDIDLLGALSLAADIEKSLIESKFYKIFTGSSEILYETIHRIHGESEGHRKRIEDLKTQVFNTPPSFDMQSDDMGISD